MPFQCLRPDNRLRWLLPGLAWAFALADPAPVSAQNARPADAEVWVRADLQIMRPIRVIPTVWHKARAAETARCIGSPKSVDDIRWYYAEAIFNLSGFGGGSGWAKGAYLPDDRALVLVYTHAWDPFTVRHEVIHHLTGWEDPLPDSIRARCEWKIAPEDRGG